MAFIADSAVRPRHVVVALLVLFFVAYGLSTRPFDRHVFAPDPVAATEGDYAYGVPLDPASPWPKFRANALQNGRSPVEPVVDPELGPWSFRTGKGVFSSGVVDAEGTIYIGSADRSFYAIRRDGTLLWRYRTGGVIDSSALLDDRGRVYFGSGDAYVYCLERASGRLVWKFRADPVSVVEERYGIDSYNVDWFEGNVAMLEDGTLLAPNDNFLVYAIDRDSGQRRGEYLGNELMWSLPAVNSRSRRMFVGSQYMAWRNLFAFDTASHDLAWTSGGWGSNAASPLLTSSASRGALVIGGFDGYVRAYAQDSGKQLWKRGVRGHVYASPAQLGDGTIIQPATDGTVYALEPETGDVRWAFDTLGPIRSSPAVDAADRIYFGNGEGRLFSLEPDGRLRWSYLLIDEERNDLNGSPALGHEGVYIGGENGDVVFVPYDYPLTDAGRQDPRTTLGPGEALPREGVFLVYTSPFGGLLLEPPATIDANQPLAFTLFVRRDGDTLTTRIDRDSLRVDVSGDPAMELHVSADRQFFTLTPQETWSGPEGGTIRVDVTGDYMTNPSRFGLKFFGGRRGGALDRSFAFDVAPREESASPFEVPRRSGDPATVLELSRFAAPNPTMLPSWNQIGFDSLHYLAGAVEGTPGKALLWVIAGRLEGGETVVDPDLAMRFPLRLEYDRGLLTLHNYDGFKVNFVGSWDMPFGFYRAATRVNRRTGAALRSASLIAVANGDEVEYYGRFLKLMGMSDLFTGHLLAYGGLDVGLHAAGPAHRPAGVGSVRFVRDATSATAHVSGGTLSMRDHVFSLLLVDGETGRPLPLYYTKRTEVGTDAEGLVTSVTVRFDPGEAPGPLRVYYMVDTYPAVGGTL